MTSQEGNARFRQTMKQFKKPHTVRCGISGTGTGRVPRVLRKWRRKRYRAQTEVRQHLQTAGTPRTIGARLQWPRALCERSTDRVSGGATVDLERTAPQRATAIWTQEQEGERVSAPFRRGLCFQLLSFFIKPQPSNVFRTTRCGHCEGSKMQARRLHHGSTKEVRGGRTQGGDKILGRGSAQSTEAATATTAVVVHDMWLVLAVDVVYESFRLRNNGGPRRICDNDDSDRREHDSDGPERELHEMEQKAGRHVAKAGWIGVKLDSTLMRQLRASRAQDEAQKLQHIPQQRVDEAVESATT